MTTPKAATLPSFNQVLEFIDIGLICCNHCVRWYTLENFYHEPLEKAIFEFYDCETNKTSHVVHAGNLCRKCVDWFLVFSYPEKMVRNYRDVVLTYYPVPNEYWKGRTISEQDYEIESRYSYTKMDSE